MIAIRRHAANIAAFVWGAAEGALFFIVPDVLLSFIGLKRGVRAAAVASLAVAVGAALGGAAMYLWSAHDGAAAYAAVLAVPAISAEMGDAAWVAIQAQGWFAAMLAGPLSRTPYKVYAVLAAHADAPLLVFAAASVIARLPRFLIVSAGAALLRRWLEPRWGARHLAWALALAWAAFYVGFFAITPG